MKKRISFTQLLLIAGLLFTVATACDKTDELSGDFSSAGTFKDADGNKYNTLKIGTQVWAVENLKTTKYNDGTAIPNVTDDNEWTGLRSLKKGAYCNYDNLESNADIYGRLYNWYAVTSGKLAPEGWHIPTDDDWTILENYLIVNGYNYDGTRKENRIAKSLCAKTKWELASRDGTPGASPEKNNRTGFTALPSGYRNEGGGNFNNLGEECEWWSSTELDDLFGGWCRVLYYEAEDLKRFPSFKGQGNPVRLVRD